jgi:hypothetical protein
MKKTLAKLIVFSIILYVTKKNDAFEGTPTTSTPPQVAQGDSLLQGKCLLSNDYLVSSDGAYKLSLSINGNLIQQVFIILFYLIKTLYIYIYEINDYKHKRKLEMVQKNGQQILISIFQLNYVCKQTER